MSEEVFNQFWQKKVVKQTATEWKLWAVFEKTSTEYVGNANVHPRPKKEEEWEIGYILRERDWGRGYAIEIARELVKYCFDELNLETVYATVDDDHRSSCDMNTIKTKIFGL